MPFESFLHKTKTKRGKLFHATVTFSVLMHAGALAWATVRSFTVVEELAPPSVKLSFMHAPVLAPAPPAPKKPETPAVEAGGGQTPRAHQALRPNVRRRPDPIVSAPTKAEEVVAPKEAPAPVAAPAVEAAPSAAPPGPAVEQPGGGPGSAAGGGGAVAGTGRGGGGPAIGGPSGGGGPTRILPEALGKLQRLSGGAPTFPAQLAKQGAKFIVMTKVCVNPAGVVDSVDFMKRADPLLDANVAAAVKAWRYRPLMTGDKAVPFCTFVRFEFTTEP